MAPRRALLRGLLLLLLLPGSAAAQSPFATAPPPPGLPPLPPVALAAGVEAAGPGTWRVAFAGEALDAGQAAAIGRLGAVLATGSIGRVTLLAMASAGEDSSTQRRLSLARGLQVKAALVAGGLPETRIDIRALGRTEPLRDGVDILAPTAPRP